MTIPKNSNKAKAAISNAHRVRCFSLSNGFNAEPLCENPHVWGGPILEGRYTQLVPITQQEFLSRELHLSRGTKLTQDVSGRYVIHVHSNLWYEFTTHDWTLEADDTRSCPCGARRTEVQS